MWYCDVCKQKIEKVEDGGVEWKTDENGNGRGLRLVHSHTASQRQNNTRCQYDENSLDGEIVGDMSLKEYTGADGLALLLSKLSMDELPKEEVIEMIQRIHIPGYEEARDHFGQAISAGIIEPNGYKGFYSQSDIKKVIESIQ